MGIPVGRPSACSGLQRALRIACALEVGRAQALRRLKPAPRGFYLALLLCPALLAHDPITTKVTWSREISRLLARHCWSCHREGGTAMPLVTYDEARPWAKAIKEQTLARAMPPWGAVKGFGAFQNDAGLTQTEIGLIADWVEGGAPLGDPAFLPKDVPAARAAARPRFRQELPVAGSFQLPRRVTLVGIRPAVIGETSLQLMARLPGGRVEPLLWLYRYDPRFAHDFYLATPLALPAGTVVESDSPRKLILLVNPGS